MAKFFTSVFHFHLHYEDHIHYKLIWSSHYHVIFRLNAVKRFKCQIRAMTSFIGNFMFLELQVEIAADRVGRNVKISSR